MTQKKTPQKKTSENKTKATAGSVPAFLDSVADDTRRSDAKALAKMMQAASGEKPRMWGPSIIGFGSVHYKYESGREGDAPLIGFSPRKPALVLYGLGASKDEALLKKLGKCSTGKGCLYIKRLSDVDAKVLDSMVKAAIRRSTAKRASAS